MGQLRTFLSKKKIITLRVDNFYSNNESNGDKNKTLSIKRYLNEIKWYLKDIRNNLKQYDTWKIQ